MYYHITIVLVKQILFSLYLLFHYEVERKNENYSSHESLLLDNAPADKRDNEVIVHEYKYNGNGRW